MGLPSSHNLTGGYLGIVFYTAFTGRVQIPVEFNRNKTKYPGQGLDSTLDCLGDVKSLQANP